MVVVVFGPSLKLRISEFNLWVLQDQFKAPNTFCSGDLGFLDVQVHTARCSYEMLFKHIPALSSSTYSQGIVTFVYDCNTRGITDCIYSRSLCLVLLCTYNSETSSCHPFVGKVVWHVCVCETGGIASVGSAVGL